MTNRTVTRRQVAASTQRRALDQVLDEAEAAGGGIGHGALSTKIVRTSSPLPWPTDTQTLWKAAAGDMVVFNRLIYANEGVKTAPGAHCVCCGHAFTTASLPAAISVTSAAYRARPGATFAMRICESCASCSDNEVLAKVGEVIAREVYPDSDLISMNA
jgi:hypothetical protein